MPYSVESLPADAICGAWFAHFSLSGTNSTYICQPQAIRNAANSSLILGPRTHLDPVWLFCFRFPCLYLLWPLLVSAQNSLTHQAKKERVLCLQNINRAQTPQRSRVCLSAAPHLSLLYRAAVLTSHVGTTGWADELYFLLMANA